MLGAPKQIMGWLQFDLDLGPLEKRFEGRAEGEAGV